MNVENVIKELRAEKKRIDAALLALVGNEKDSPAISPVVSRKVKRHLSSVIKNKISLAQKERWAHVKLVNSNNAAKAFAANFTLKAQSSIRRSIAQKARWATAKAIAASNVNPVALNHMDGVAV